jgi:Family of unknown function (DUF6152)
MPVSLRYVVALAAVLGCGPLWAHHGFGGRYDRANPVILEGRVEAARWRPPHPMLTLRVVEGAEPLELPGLGDLAEHAPKPPTVTTHFRGRSVDIEFPPVQRFFGLADRIRVGDRVAVVALRNCDEPHQLRGQYVRLADGHVVLRSGRMQREVSGC